MSAAAAAQGGPAAKLAPNYDNSIVPAHAEPIMRPTGSAGPPPLDPNDPASKDPRMIAAMVQLGHLYAAGYRLEGELTQLKAQKEATKDPEAIKTLDAQADLINIEYKTNQQAIKDTTEVAEKLHRTIDTAVGPKPDLGANPAPVSGTTPQTNAAPASNSSTETAPASANPNGAASQNGPVIK
jgi:hypothetical protein